VPADLHWSHGWILSPFTGKGLKYYLGIILIIIPKIIIQIWKHSRDLFIGLFVDSDIGT
jgi:hypothetical protein